MRILRRKKKNKKTNQLPPGRLAEEEMIKGNRSESGGNLGEAIIHYKNAAKYYLKAGIGPLAAKAYYMAGELYIKMGNIEEGLAMLENSYALDLSYGYNEDADKIRMLIDGYRSGNIKLSVSLRFPNKWMEEEWQSVVEMASRHRINIDRYVIALRALLENNDVEEEVKVISLEKIISEASKYVIDVGGKIDELQHLLRSGDSYYKKAVELYRKDAVNSLTSIKSAKSEYSKVLSTGYLTPSAEESIKRRLEELNRYEYTANVLISINEIKTSLQNLMRGLESVKDLKNVERDVERIYKRFSEIVSEFSTDKDKYDPLKIRTIERKISKLEEEFEIASERIESEYQRREEEEIKERMSLEKVEEEKSESEKEGIAVMKEDIETERISKESAFVSKEEKEQKMLSATVSNQESVVVPVMGEVTKFKNIKEVNKQSQSKRSEFIRKSPRRDINLPGKKIKVSGMLENYLLIALSYEEKGGLVFHVYVENYSDTTIADVTLRFDFGTIMAETLKYMEHEPESIIYKDGKFSIGTLTPSSSLEITILYDILHYGMVRVEATFSGVSPSGERLRASGSENITIKKPSFREIIRENRVHTALLKTLFKDLRYKDILTYNLPPRYTEEEIYRDVFGIITREHEHLREYGFKGEYESWFGELSQSKYLIKLSVKRNEIRIEMSFESKQKLVDIRRRIDDRIKELYEKKYKEVGKSVKVTHVNVHQEVRDAVMYQKGNIVDIEKEGE